MGVEAPALIRSDEHAVTMTMQSISARSSTKSPGADMVTP